MADVLHDGKKSELFKEHFPNYVNTVTVTRLQSGTQNSCFLSSIFGHILKLIVYFLPFSPRGDKGGREGVPHTHPYSIGNSSQVIFKNIDPKGDILDNSHSHSANVFRVDYPRSEPRVLHELTQKKMAGDAESEISICFVAEND